MLTHQLARRRAAVAIAGLLAVAVLAGGAGIAAAGSGGPKGADPNAAAALAKPAAGARANAPDPGVPSGLLAETRQALDGLVSDGAIDQDQADAIQSRVASGSIDTQEVIASGVLDAAQMERVNEVLRRIKLSYTGP